MTRPDPSPSQSDSTPGRTDTNPFGTRANGYDPLSNVAGVTDTAGGVTADYRDTLGRLTQVTLTAPVAGTGNTAQAQAARCRPRRSGPPPSPRRGSW